MARRPASEPRPAPRKPCEKQPESGDQFPLPRGAAAPESAAGGGGKIQTYQVPRGKDAVLAGVRGALEAGGWTVVKDETSPRGAVRLEVKNGEKTWKASFVVDATRTAIVLALP